MARSSQLSQSFALPNGIRTIVKNGPAEYWDVKFYPYLTERDDPIVFAVVGGFYVHICQATNEDDLGLRFLATYERSKAKQSDTHTFNTCTWCYLKHEEPLLALAGESGLIQVVDAFTGYTVHTLVGHGIGTVNELTTHPKYPWIIASCSMDSSVRIWDLRRAHDSTASSCVIICGHGFGHSDGLLSICWHDTGRYLLSSGFDQKICVWTLPDLHADAEFWKGISKENRKRSSDEVRIIYYPHFVTTALHLNYVDRVAWYGDLVLSKGVSPDGKQKDDRIILWAITGFNSDLEPPPEDTAPKTQDYLETRNGFMRTPKVHLDDDVFDHNEKRIRTVAPYQRFLELACPNVQAFYMRFGLTKKSDLFPDLHDIITIGDSLSSIRHWDLEQLIVGHDGNLEAQSTAKNSRQRASTLHKQNVAKSQRLKHGSYGNVLSRIEAASDTVSSVSSLASPVRMTPSDAREASTDATSSVNSEPLTTEEPRPDRKRYPLHKPYEALKEHRKNTIATLPGFCARTAAWSVCGKICVVVGDQDGTGAIVVLDRPI